VFDQIPAVPPDAILGLAALFKADDRPGKLDLTAGVYKDETGRVPKFACIAEAERRYLETEDTKVYLPIDGAPAFTAATQELVFGPISALDPDRLRTTQTPGGTGALALVAHALAQTVGPRRVWLSDPTWPNHPSIFEAAGHAVTTYRYYRSGDRSLDADGLLEDLSRVERGDVVLLHGCCHNPTGRDLTPALWRSVAALLAERGAVALVDLAYLGLADGLEEDGAFLADVLVEGLEAFVCTSYSKNLGMYRERVGALTVVAGDGAVAEAVQTNLKRTVRSLWSNPPSLGGQAVATVLTDPELRADWLVELSELRGRLNGLRVTLAKAIADAGLEGFAGIESERGMFTLTGITPAQVDWLREERAIYLVGNSRANVAGLTDATIPTLVDALGEVAARPA
jgi:aspartate/tyrosine/aromatic aminotransferase